MHCWVRFLQILICTAPCLILSISSYSQDDVSSTTRADSVYVKLKKALEWGQEQDEPELIAQRLIDFCDFYTRNEAVNQALFNYQKAAGYLSEEHTSELQ